MEPIRLVFTGGGSGGHIYPLIAVYEALARKATAMHCLFEVVYIGPKDRFSLEVEEAGMRAKYIIGGKLRRYFSITNIFYIPKFLIGCIQAICKMFFIMPDAVFSKGGTGSLPVVLAARLYRIPIIVHESDSVPGSSNLLAARFATRIGVSFPSATSFFPSDRVFVSGAPLREFLFIGKLDRATAKQQLGYDPSRPLTVILGASQGSEMINEFTLLHLKEFMNETQVFHQTGEAHFDSVSRIAAETIASLSLPRDEEGSGKAPYQAVAYITNELQTVLTAADIVIARASSSTIFEVAAFSKPAILIPISHAANDHQRENAYIFAKAGGGIVIEEANLLPTIMMHAVQELLTNKDKYSLMAIAAGKFFIPNGAENIAGEIIKASGMDLGGL